MEQKHTSGPWASNAGRRGHWPTVTGPDGKIIANVNPASGIDSVTMPGDANARLIAAAPDLLAVLQELEESSYYYWVPSGIVARIKGAISKATGEAA